MSSIESFKLPSLYRQRKDGKYQICNISVVPGEGDEYEIHTLHGIEDGRKQTDVTVVSSGKNIGKANETSVYEQALADAESKHKRKIKTGYSDTKTSIADSKFLPMLAHEYNKRVSSVFRAKDKADIKELTIVVQPKLDGIRASIYKDSKGVVQMYTRTGGVLTHLGVNILPVFKSMDKGLVIDGELYIEDGDIQKIAGAANKKDYDPERHDSLCFVIFDVYDKSNPELGFTERFKNAKAFYREDYVFPVDLYSFSMGTCKTFNVKTEPDLKKEVEALHRSATDQGFEGVMVRIDSYPYLIQKRSIGLLKYKTFFDQEYEILDIITPATGRCKGMAIYVCSTEKDLQFNVDSVGTATERRAIYDKKDSLIGKMLTVQYQDFTLDGKPRFPKGIVIRDYE